MKYFALNQVFTNSKGGRYVGTYETIKDFSIWEDAIDGYVEWEEKEYEGISIMPEDYSNYHVVMNDNKLFLGECEVTDYQNWVDMFSSLSNQIPRYYVIRKIDGEFICGFDLMNNGRAWEGLSRTESNNVEIALGFLRCQLGTDFYICLEEPMRINI